MPPASFESHKHGVREDEHAHHGHGEHPPHPPGGGHEHQHAEEFRRRFWISLAFAVPVVAFSPMIRDWLGLPDVTGPQEAVAPVFGTLFVYGGRPFLAGAVSELRSRQPRMMTLIALAITVAFVASTATLLGLLDLEFAGVLAPVGIVLAPVVGAILMSISMVVVAINAQLLRRLDLRPDGASTQPA